MIRIADKSQCCGCTACYAVCPHGAISMIPDDLGFMYPQVDSSRCVDCGLCDKVCAFHPQVPCDVTEAFAVRHRNMAEVEASTSGAVFVALTDRVLSDGGTVYGAAFEANDHVVHKRADDLVGRDSFRKSKYVQSDMGDMFRSVLKDLSDGRKVLFSGTPCQVAGLKSFIGPKLARNLYLVDIVCHGVPSPKVWKDYVSWRESTAGMKAETVNFRDKSCGWRSSVESFVFNGVKSLSTSYSYLYYKNIMMRESCGVCPYASLSRQSDITIADYWRKDKRCPEFASDNKGCSLVLCGTIKGREFLDEVSEHLHVADADLAGCIQHNLASPTVLHKDSEVFARDFSRYGLEYVMKRYGDMGWRFKIKDTFMKIYRCIRQTARKIAGRA